MNKTKKSTNTRGNINQFKSTNSLKKIRSKYILKEIFDNLKINIKFEIIKYNKNIQDRLSMNINDYKEYRYKYSEIIIEIIPLSYSSGKIINILNKSDEIFFHIYINDNNKCIKRTKFFERDKAKKIKIIIDYQIKSFKDLFKNCRCIETINFIKFKRNNINDMSYMFSGCSSLEEINFLNFNTESVTNMSHMFYNCSWLKKLNLSTFNTNSVIDMSYMFYNCSWLTNLIVSNFNTHNVIDMSHMFHECSSLKKLNLSNFHSTNLKKVNYLKF